VLPKQKSGPIDHYGNCGSGCKFIWHSIYIHQAMSKGGGMVPGTMKTNNNQGGKKQCFVEIAVLKSKTEHNFALIAGKR
jgi:hypothetical protein